MRSRLATAASTLDPGSRIVPSEPAANAAITALGSSRRLMAINAPA